MRVYSKQLTATAQNPCIIDEIMALWKHREVFKTVTQLWPMAMQHAGCDVLWCCEKWFFSPSQNSFEFWTPSSPSYSQAWRLEGVVMPQIFGASCVNPFRAVTHLQVNSKFWQWLLWGCWGELVTFQEDVWIHSLYVTVWSNTSNILSHRRHFR